MTFLTSATKSQRGQMKPAEMDAALEELWLQQAELLDGMEAIHEQLRQRDKINLLLTRHVERLVREKETLLMHVGLTALTKSLNAKAFSDLDGG